MKWSNNNAILDPKIPCIFPRRISVKIFTDNTTEGITKGNIKIGITNVLALEYMAKADTNVPTTA